MQQVDFQELYGKQLPQLIRKEALAGVFPHKWAKHEIERYITKPKIIQWNEYCIKKLCEAIIPILDIYWMAASYPHGTMDATHYEHSVFESAANFMIGYIS